MRIVLAILLYLTQVHAAETPPFRLVFYNTAQNRFAILTATESGLPIPAADMRPGEDRERWHRFAWQLYLGTRQDMRAQRIGRANVEPEYGYVELHTSTGPRAILSHPQSEQPEFYMQDPNVLVLLTLEELAKALAGDVPGRTLDTVDRHVRDRYGWLRDPWTRVTMTEAEFARTFRWLKDLPPRQMTLSQALRCAIAFDR